MCWGDRTRRGGKRERLPRTRRLRAVRKQRKTRKTKPGRRRRKPKPRRRKGWKRKLKRRRRKNKKKRRRKSESGWARLRRQEFYIVLVFIPFRLVFTTKSLWQELNTINHKIQGATGKEHSLAKMPFDLIDNFIWTLVATYFDLVITKVARNLEMSDNRSSLEITTWPAEVGKRAQCHSAWTDQAEETLEYRPRQASEEVWFDGGPVDLFQTFCNCHVMTPFCRMAWTKRWPLLSL